MQFPIKVTETKTSTIFSGESAWVSLNDLIVKMQEKSQKTFILVDDCTERFCLPVFLSKLPGLQHPEILRISPGETSKTTEAAFLLWNKLSSGEAERDSILINLGGGVVSDLGGFVASTYKRGIPFINVPTTLMAMADAAIGGKTAINLQSIKNIVGSFYLPVATFIFPRFLKTLDNSNLLSGFAEIFKIALVADLSLCEYLNSLTFNQLLATSFDEKVWEELIARSISIKCKLVEMDFFDKKERAILNFGHTFGHAFEALSYQECHKPISHGWAVSMGILCESYLSVRYCGLTENDFAQISRLFLSTFGYYPLSDKDIPEILRYMNQDKKMSPGGLKFTLLKSPGKAVINQLCDKSSILDSLEFYRQINAKH